MLWDSIVFGIARQNFKTFKLDSIKNGNTIYNHAINLRKAETFVSAFLFFVNPLSLIKGCLASWV
jgi:hypothetical protein